MNNNVPPKITKGQFLHFGSLILLLPLVWYGWKLIGYPYPVLFWVTIGIPVIHQVYVWLAWRIELRIGGTANTIGFKGYIVIFFLLFIGRFLALIVLAWSDSESLDLQLIPRVILTTVFALIAIYAMYSVLRYFGLSRAAGADHFYPRYREMSLVKKGIFRFSENGMYVYAFLLHWAIATGFNSEAAMVAAAFSHIYIWIHFYATEKPDMDFLYGRQNG